MCSSLDQKLPQLEKMKISVIMDWEGSDASPVSDFLNVQDYSDVLLNQLQEVRLESISGTVSEMTLIMLLLEKSPKLKRMVIQYRSDLFRPSTEKVYVILKEVNKVWRASPNAMVIYEN
ncbi:Hypothetical predicted protein [Olea europaea subsp. europaea]|uniref:FBD domain-containing protein n=1 Tax=Olea europaea subsp. europaea TaxID=158383 RepID=A0A8S0R9K0_OLEEU|nr:Hypothetical predicted protein [Olea europaea subsp. europaea]